MHTANQLGKTLAFPSRVQQMVQVSRYAADYLPSISIA